MTKQYSEVVTNSQKKKLKSSLPDRWREELPLLSGVSIATIDNFFRGQKLKDKTVNKIINGISDYLKSKKNEMQEMRNKISEYIDD